MAAVPETARYRAELIRLLRPSSIAIIGASEKIGSFGASVLSNLLAWEYSGTIYLVNPKRTHIGEHACLQSIHDLPYGVDCAVLAIPKAAVLDSIRACASRGVGSAIIFSVGFAESGEEGKSEQAEITRIAQQSHMAIAGPNCLGIVNAVDDIPLTFIRTPRLEALSSKGVAVISQSGAMAAVLGVALRSNGLGLTYSISTGNEAVSGVEDYVEFLLDDSQTNVIALLVEQFREPRRFVALAQRAAEQGKSIVLLHPGSSSAARTSSATHTGAIAGDHDVMRAHVTAAGVCIVETLEELIDVSHILARCPVVPSGGTAVLTESGAFKALTLDLCERLALPLPPLSQQTEIGLRSVLPDFVVLSNPLDVTAHGLVDPDLYRRTLPILLSDSVFGVIVLTMILTDESTARLKLPSALEAIAGINLTRPVVFAALDEGAPMPEEFRNRLHDLGVPFFPTAERAFRAIARVHSKCVRESTYPSHLSERTAFPHKALGEFESKQILRSLGLPIPAGALAHSSDEAVEIAKHIGFPVVLKAQSSELPHKIDAGGVVLNLHNPDKLIDAWLTLHHNLQINRPELTLDGILVEKMSERGTEFLIGVKNDPDWGPTLLIGLGGIFAEALKDIRVLPLYLTEPEIVEEIRALRGAAIFNGFRGSPPPDLLSIAAIVRRIGQFSMSHPGIQEIDLNPVVAHSKGAIILDAFLICS